MTTCAASQPAPCFDASQRRVRFGEPAGNDGRCVGKTLRMNHSRFRWPANNDDGRGHVGFDELDGDCVGLR